MSSLFVPAILLLVGALFFTSRRDPYSAFLAGARSGMESILRIFPSLLMLLCSLTVFTASGLAETVAAFLAPAAARVGIPAEILTLILVRPVSGSGALAAYSSLLDQYGPDSFPGLCASVIVGSSDTLVYIAAVYFSAARVERTRYTLPVGFAVSALTVLLSCALCRIFFA